MRKSNSKAENIVDNLDAVNDSLGEMLNSLSSAAVLSENPLSNRVLNESTYNNLYAKSRVFQNMVNLIPEDANIEYPQITSQNSNTDTSSLQQQLESIASVGEPLEPIDLKGAITLAGIYAKLYGDGFIFMGIRDGGLPSEPVNWDRVEGIDWVIVRNKYEVSLNTSRNTVNMYQSGYNVAKIEATGEPIGTSVEFHISRVHRFTGVSRHGTDYQRDGFNMSVIDGVYSDYQRYLASIQQGAKMLESHSVFKFGMSGLSSKANKTSVTASLRKRFQNILDGVSILGGVMYDKSTEEVEYANRSYSGVKDILEHLRDWLIGNSGLPQNKLFGSAASNSLSNQSQGEKDQWNEIINRYRASQVIPFYDKILCILALSSNQDLNELNITFKPYYQLNDQEIAQSEEARASALKSKVEAITSALESGLIDRTRAKELFESF